jgi:hypothetical protein
VSAIYYRLRNFLRFRKHIILIAAALALATCIDPYNPDIRGKEAMLVVDGLLTNENRSYTVTLSRTTASQNESPGMVGGAMVTITDEDQNSFGLSEVQTGIYKTDSLSFTGVTGSKYTLHIRTPDGSEYRSDECIMYPVDPIDSAYFRKDQEITTGKDEILDGLRVYIDAANRNGGRYFRWTYDEWWKFSVPNPKRYDYIDPYTVVDVDTLKQVCWGHAGTSRIMVRSSESSQSGRIDNEPILFVASTKSDRLLLRYCVIIKQYSLSQEEYLFWDQLRETNEMGGEIFERQPFSITGNIHNIAKPSETVLGYFQVSAVSEKRLYISSADVKELGLPKYRYDCQRIEIGPSDYPYANVTLDNIYQAYVSTGFVFIEPIYDMRLNIIKLVFTRPACSLCTSRGSLKKPGFWEDQVSGGTGQ